MQDASSRVATAPCAQGPGCSYPATLVAQSGAQRGPGAGSPERSRASERLEASMAGLAELELLRRRHEALVRGVLEAPASADQDQHQRHQHPHQHHSGSVSARQQPLERDFVESLRAMKEQLGCLPQRDLGLLSRLRHLNEQFSELKMDMDRAAVKQSETDSRPSSGYYDLSDGSLSNSCNSIFSDCLSGSRSSLGSCSPPGRAAPSPASPAAVPAAAAETHPGFTPELPLFRGPGEHPREMCGLLPAAGATAAAKAVLPCPQQQGRARERPLSSGDLLRIRSDTSGAGTATRRSLPDDPTPGPPPPAACPSARGTEASGRYVSDLTSRDGSDVYRYPSPLHAVAIQSPLFLHCPSAASAPHDARTSRRLGGSAQRPCSGFVPSPGPVPLSRDGVANERVSGYICSLLDRKRVPGASGGTGAKLSRMESFNAGPNMPITNGRLKPKHEEKAVTPENINLGADPKPDTLQGVDSCKEVIPEKNVQTINESEAPRCHQQRSEPSPSPKSKEQTKLIANVLPLRCNDSPKRTGGLPSHLSRVKGSSRVERYEEDSKPSSSRVSHQVPRGIHATPGKGVEPRYRDAMSKQQIVEERFALPKDRSRALNVSNHGAVVKATHGKLDKRTGGRNVVPRAQPRADAGNCRTNNGHVLLKGNRQPHHRSMESVESRRKGSGRKTAIKSSKKYGAHADWNGNKRLGPTKARPPKVEEPRARRRDEDRMQNPAACAERCCRDVVSRADGRDCRKSAAAAAAGGGGRGVKRLAQQPKGHSRELVQSHGAAHGRVPAPPPPQQQPPHHRRRPAPARVRVHPPALAHARMARAYVTAVARADSDSERSEYSAECESFFHGTVMDTSEDEMSDHTTNRFGDGETSASEGVPCSEVDDDYRDDDEEEEVATDSDSDGDAGGFSVSTGSSASDEDEEDDVDNGGRQQSKGVPLAGRRGGQKAPAVAAPVAARGPEARGGGGARGQQHAACRIKASRSLKKKMMHFRSGSLKVITTV